VRNSNFVLETFANSDFARRTKWGQSPLKSQKNNLPNIWINLDFVLGILTQSGFANLILWCHAPIEKMHQLKNNKGIVIKLD